MNPKKLLKRMNYLLEDHTLPNISQMYHPLLLFFKKKTNKNFMYIQYDTILNTYTLSTNVDISDGVLAICLEMKPTYCTLYFIFCASMALEVLVSCIHKTFLYSVAFQNIKLLRRRCDCVCVDILYLSSMKTNKQI